MSGALAIMVKTPGHSPIKSRLAAGVGDRAAQVFHRLAAVAAASVARRARDTLGIETYWAVAEPAAHGEWTGLPVLAQGEGGLGRRMAQVQAQLVARHGGGMLVGADSPQLKVALLREARDWIEEGPRRLALGPAADGGFWLFAANFSPPLAAWESVEYSRADTAVRLQATMSDVGQLRLLPTLVDVDEAKDLPMLAAALRSLADPTPEQVELLAWVDSCMPANEHRQGSSVQIHSGIGVGVSAGCGAGSNTDPSSNRGPVVAARRRPSMQSAPRR